MSNSMLKIVLLFIFGLICSHVSAKKKNKNIDDIEEYQRYQYTTSNYENQLRNAIKWLISERDSNFGWGENTARALTALYIARSKDFEERDSDLLMKKQLDVQLSVELAKNDTYLISLSDLALYINALQATCRDPRNFNGFDLVSLLRDRVNRLQHLNKFVSPLVYKTLCMNNATHDNDVRKIREYLNSNQNYDRIGFYSLALLTSLCIERTPRYQASNTRAFLDEFTKRILYKTQFGLPKNIYETALLLQAVNAANIKNETLKREAMEFLLRSQNETTGAFEDILATYYVLPLLADKTMLSLKDHCNDVNEEENRLVVRNPSESFVHYTLRYGKPVELQQTLQLKVPVRSNFVEVMKLAQSIDPNYRFQLDNGRTEPQVYSIGGIPNDAERGIYWRLYLNSAAARRQLQTQGRKVTQQGELPYTGSIKNLILESSDEAIFWLHPIQF